MPTLHVCRWCRAEQPGEQAACATCGAALTRADHERFAGWDVRPPVPDLAIVRFGRATAQLTSGLGPIAHLSLSGQETIVFSHHALLHMDRNVQVQLAPAQRPWSALRGGMPPRLLEASGTGELAIAAHDAGEVVAVPLSPAMRVCALPHRFLAATGGTEMRFVPSRLALIEDEEGRLKTEWVGSRWVDEFRASGEPQVLLLHAPGEVLVHELGRHGGRGAGSPARRARAATRLLVRPGALLWWDAGLDVAAVLEDADHRWMPIATMWPGLAWVEFTGQGRVAVATGASHAHVVHRRLVQLKTSAVCDGDGRFTAAPSRDIRTRVACAPVIGELDARPRRTRRERYQLWVFVGLVTAVLAALGAAAGGIVGVLVAIAVEAGFISLLVTVAAIARWIPPGRSWPSLAEPVPPLDEANLDQPATAGASSPRSPSVWRALGKRRRG